MNNKYTWEQLVSLKEGTVLVDKFDEGVRIFILRGPSSICCYLGIPIDHPLAGLNYNNIPIDCHGGFTFGGEGDGGYRPGSFYYYGWDYGHSGDYAFYYDTITLLQRYSHEDEKKWLLEDVENDMWNTLYNFKLLVKLSETIISKKYKIVTNETLRGK